MNPLPLKPLQLLDLIAACNKKYIGLEQCAMIYIKQI